MFGFSKNKKKNDDQIEAPEKKSWFSKLSDGLKRSRENLSENLGNVFFGKKEIDAELLEGLETALLLADVGSQATQDILDAITQKVKRREINDADLLKETLKQEMLSILEPCCQPLDISTNPFAILMVGVNGAGKTTTIAKLAHYYQQSGKKVMLAAGDTFRAAAVEQLQAWGEKNNAPVIAQHTGADSASVIFDGMQAAESRHYDLLIADTAGRLHTQDNLMNELLKIKRVMKKQNDAAPQETMLILDASIGQNALAQAKQFHEAIGLTSISLTKLDGTAKGGIVFAIAKEMQLPIRFIGVGEGLSDLKPFSADEFVNALIN